MKKFQELVSGLKKAVDQTQAKILAKEKPVTDPLVEEVDALVDLLYFTYGSFYLNGRRSNEADGNCSSSHMGKTFSRWQNLIISSDEQSIKTR